MTYIATYPNPKNDVVDMRHPEFPNQPGPLVFDRVRYKAMETLPRGTRMVHQWSKHASTMTIVFEEPPTMRLVHYMADEFYFPTPWVVYFITFQNNRAWVDRLAYNTESIRNINSYLKIPVLPNIYIEQQQYCKVCPASEAMTLIHFKEAAIRYDLTIAAAIASFWASHFNDDITAYRGYLPMPFVGHSFLGMEALDELTVCDVPWAEGATVKQILSQMEYGSAITKPERIHAGASSYQCLYQELSTALALDTYEEVIGGAPRPETHVATNENGHEVGCDCDDCYDPDED